MVVRWMVVRWMSMRDQEQTHEFGVKDAVVVVRGTWLGQRISLCSDEIALGTIKWLSFYA